MLLPLKLLSDRRARKDGTSPICIQYCLQTDERTLLNTEVNIPACYWNKKLTRISKELPKEFGDAQHLNEALSRQMRIVEDIILFAKKNKIEDEISFLKKTFHPKFDVTSLAAAYKEADLLKEEKGDKTSLDIYRQIDDYIRSKEKRVCKDMPRIYRNMKEHLKAFEEFKGEPITFDSLNLDFYEELVDFLTYDYIQRRRKVPIIGLKVNTIGKTIKQFRTFLRNRIRKRIIPPIDMDGWNIIEEEVDAVYLTIKEIKELHNLDLSHHSHLIKYRNDFVLGCLTGLRFSDFSEVMKDDVREDMLYKKQNKSDHWVVIPLRDEAIAILRDRFSKDVSVLTNAEFNRHIKTIAKLAGLNDLIKHSYKKRGKDIIETKPKYSWITSHTCRRSFCTNEFLAGTPVELIMKISGHKSVKDFYKYIRITPEEAGQKIKELWKSRGSMSAFENKERIAS